MGGRSGSFEENVAAFHKVAGDTLLRIVKGVEAVESDIRVPGFDIHETVRTINDFDFVSWRRTACVRSTWVARARTSSTSRHRTDSSGFLRH